MSMNSPPDRRVPPSRIRPPRMWLYSFAGLALLSVISGATPPSLNPLPTPAGPEAPQQLAPTTPVSTTVAPVANPMDEPVRLIAEAQQAYANVHDYSCMLIKKEKIGKQPPVENVISMRVRTEPFGVNLRWLEPKALVGQEAVYVTGKNDGKMRVKSAGLLGAVGFVSLDPNDARVQETSKHAITEAGIGNLLVLYAMGWENERKWNLTQVNIADYEYNKRRCVRVETTHPTNPENKFWFYRNVVYFDKETKLPIRAECYQWPEKDGKEPELVEVYSYVNMKLNVGLPEEVFNK
jgi:Protein of unknown function (DUF1571)